ncbi:MAG: hypothetical protein E7213_07450 [Clostridium sp.]|nr:hypothetical protein [Clostridium sp.]
MSKHRHKSRDINSMRDPSFNNNCMNNNPFGISPQQLLSLLGSNIDMNGLGNILSSMGQEGFNLNSVNTQSTNQENYRDIDNIVNNSGFNFNKNSQFTNENNNVTFGDDENIKFLQSIKNIVSNERAEFIDKIIEMYNSGAFKDFTK